MKIGFCGLGLMGAPMVRRLLAAGANPNVKLDGVALGSRKRTGGGPGRGAGREEEKRQER